MTKEEKIKLAQECGMVYSGENADGEIEFIGTTENWKRYEQAIEEEMAYGEMESEFCPHHIERNECAECTARKLGV